MQESEPGRRVGYVELLRGNRHFRRLTIGRLISQTGDWFNSVALFTLLLNLTGSGEAVGLVLIIKLLPQFLSPSRRLQSGRRPPRRCQSASVIAPNACHGLR